MPTSLPRALRPFRSRLVPSPGAALFRFAAKELPLELVDLGPELLDLLPELLFSLQRLLVPALPVTGLLARLEDLGLGSQSRRPCSLCTPSRNLCPAEICASRKFFGEQRKANRRQHPRALARSEAGPGRRSAGSGADRAAPGRPEDKRFAAQISGHPEVGATCSASASLARRNLERASRRRIKPCPGIVGRG